jgi:hypothetical protein
LGKPERVVASAIRAGEGGVASAAATRGITGGATSPRAKAASAKRRQGRDMGRGAEGEASSGREYWFALKGGAGETVHHA